MTPSNRAGESQIIRFLSGNARELLPVVGVDRCGTPAPFAPGRLQNPAGVTKVLRTLMRGLRISGAQVRGYVFRTISACSPRFVARLETPWPGFGSSTSGRLGTQVSKSWCAVELHRERDELLLLAAGAEAKIKRTRSSRLRLKLPRPREQGCPSFAQALRAPDFKRHAACGERRATLLCRSTAGSARAWNTRSRGSSQVAGRLVTKLTH